MKAIAINEAEWALLEGVSHLQFRLYMVLRWFMDRRTGVSGLVRGISQQSLIEELYVEPMRGRHRSLSGSPSRQALRSALDGLAAAGLISQLADVEKLAFFLPKAGCVSARSKHEQPMSNHDQQPDEQPRQAQAHQGFNGYEQPDEQEGVSADEQPTSGVRVNPLYTPSVGGSLRAREFADPDPSDIKLERVGVLCRKLRLQGIEAAPHLFTHPDWQRLLERCTDEDIIGAAAIAKQRKPENVRLHLNYLKPMLNAPPEQPAKTSRAAQRTDFFNQLGIGAANGSRRQDERIVDAEARRVD